MAPPLCLLATPSRSVDFELGRRLAMEEQVPITKLGSFYSARSFSRLNLLSVYAQSWL